MLYEVITVLGKGAGVKLQPLVAHEVDRLFGKQTYLTVPVARMGITDNAVINPQFDLLHRFFIHTFFPTDVQ